MSGHPVGDATSSVSRGCFVFTPSKKTKKCLDPKDYFEVEGNFSESSVYHASTCEVLWNDISEDVEALQTDVNETIFEDLVQFVSQAQTRFDPGSEEPNKSVSTAVQEIPTAALITGVNTPDHHAMFAAIIGQLKEKVTPHVAEIHSKDCNTLKGLMASVIGQLMGAEDLMSDDEEVEINVKKIPCTMPVLCSWYKETVEKREKQRSSPSKTPKRKSSRKRRSSILYNSNYAKHPCLVLIFEDMESVPSAVLQDFILVSSQYLEKLPLVLVFGIATAVTAIHRTLPQSVSSLLSIEKFQAVPSSVYLTQLINKVLLSYKHPFKLGHKVFQFLLDLFLYHDFSVRNFSKGIQFSLMDHFFNQPLSLLCCGYGEGLNRLRSMSHDQLELFRKAASFRTYVEGQPPEEQRDLLLDDKHLKKVLQELLKKLSDYHKTFYPVMLCLHELTFDLPHHPLGKQVRELYSFCLESNINENKVYEEAFGLLGILARDELVSLLGRCAEKLSEGEAGLDDIQAIRFHLETIETKLDTLGELCNQPEEEDENTESENPESLNTSTDGNVKTKTTLHSLQQQLMQSAKKKKKLTRYEVLRKEALDYLHSVFRKYLVCPQTLTLHEIFYYNNVGEVRRHINASPRAAIQTALDNPYHYLQSDLCKAEGGSILSTFPDVCIVYKLHLECGRLINLYDWMQAFVTVVQGGEDEADGEKKAASKKKADPVLQARFIRAVSELQFLGFIKSTKRKTDHVARLTWGGC
ncbi:origin recognition complex subunit 3-like [Amphiura filiformis]|uniref:origin recognition complex subunit 3-like n=1 Tax=Amphiura filiformis TaxID=82378 RepID=UPI003B21459E